MNEDVSMYRSQCYGNDDLCERCDHMYTHTHTLNEWMNEVNECEWKREFLGEHSLSWNEVLSRKPTNSQELSNVHWGMETHCELRCGV